MAKKPPPPPPPPKGKKAPPPPPPPKPKKAPPPKAKAKSKGTQSKAPKKAPPRKKKGRKIKIKLGLRQKKLSIEEDTYQDQVGWTISQEVLDPYDAPQVEDKLETVEHQCSMCGSIMQIPQPKRDRYKVICAYSECGHEDKMGI